MQDMFGDTPLIQAYESEHLETASVLLKHGANVDQQNYVSSTIRWNPSKTDTIGINDFIHCSKVPYSWKI